MKKQNPEVEAGSKAAPESFYIHIQKDGPYLVFGNPPCSQQYIRENEQGESWEYEEGKKFKTAANPTALCRCGASAHKPYCDGAHTKADWNGAETATKEPLLDGAEVISGPTMDLYDNEKYCAFARFCDAYGRVWNLVLETDKPEARELVRHEVDRCPGGRLVIKDKKSGEFIEPHYEPSLGLIEDNATNSSGPLWVRGGIKVVGQEGEVYQIRNRVALCRCGQSSNKPFCDGTHASFHFNDGLKDTEQ